MFTARRAVAEHGGKPGAANGRPLDTARTALAGELQRAGLDVVFKHVEAAHPMVAWVEALINAGPVEEAEAGNAAP